MWGTFMKRQVFFFLLGYVCSAYSMDHGINKITKDQFIQGLTDFNYYMKKRHRDSFDAKQFGSFIIALRGENKDLFEIHQKELLAFIGLSPDVFTKR